MRHFSSNEKQSILQIVNYSDSTNTFVLIRAYNDIFQKQKVKFQDSKLFFYRTINSFDIDEFLSIESLILETTLLLDYLERERYIYFIEDNETTTLESINDITQEEGLVSIEKDLDPYISKILIRSLNHRAYVSQELKDLVNNNFETIEDQMLNNSKEALHKASCQTWFAFITLLVSIVALILSI